MTGARGGEHTPGAEAPFPLRAKRPKAKALGYLEARDRARVFHVERLVCSWFVRSDLLSSVILLGGFASGYGGRDDAGGPGGGFGDEAVEDRAGGGADFIAALGVPLNAEDEVGVAFGGLAALYGFDDGVLRAAGGDAEAVAGDRDGLMMAGVDGETEESVLLGGFFGGICGFIS